MQQSNFYSNIIPHLNTAKITGNREKNQLKLPLHMHIFGTKLDTKPEIKEKTGNRNNSSTKWQIRLAKE